MKYIFLLLIFTSFLSRSQPDFYTAEKLYKQEKYNLAKPLFEEVIRQNPNHYKSLEYLGDIAAYSKQWNVALAYFSTIKTANPDSADSHYKYGGVLSMIAQKSSKFQALSLVSEIRESFEKAMVLNPQHIETHWALIEFYLQLPAIFGGSERKAVQYANQLSKISPVDGFLAKGHIAEYFERYTTAEKFYKQAIAFGHSKTTYQKLASLYTNKLHSPGKAKATWDDYAKMKR